MLKAVTYTIGVIIDRKQPDSSAMQNNPIAFIRRYDNVYGHRFSVKPYYYRTNSGRGAKGEFVANSDTPRILDRRLTRNQRHLPDLIWIGQGCDPYPRIEKWVRLTRRLIEIVAKHNCPLFMITRSSLILRDIDLIREVHEMSKTTIAVSLPSINRKISRTLEPNTPAPSDRIKTLSRIRRSSVRTGIVVPYIIPGINDHPRDLERLFRTAGEHNFSFILFPTRYSVKKGKYLPERDLPLVDNLFDPTSVEIPLEQKDKAERVSLYDLLLQLSHKYRIPLRKEKFIPQDFRRENYWIAGMLTDIALLRQLKGRSYRGHLAVASKVKQLDHDIRNSIRFNTLLDEGWIDPDVKPDLENLINGNWISREFYEGWFATASK